MLVERLMRFFENLGVRDAREMRVEHDSRAITLHYGEKQVYELPWSEVARIGYATTDQGPWSDDHLLVFRSRLDSTKELWISLDWPGALRLSEYVETLPGATLAEKGSLANVTTNDSVTIWPAAHAGEPF